MQGAVPYELSLGVRIEHPSEAPMTRLLMTCGTSPSLLSSDFTEIFRHSRGRAGPVRMERTAFLLDFDCCLQTPIGRGPWESTALL